MTDDQEAAGKPLAGWMAHRIYGLQGNQHRRDHGLARAFRKLQRRAHQLGVRLLIRSHDRGPDP